MKPLSKKEIEGWILDIIEQDDYDDRMYKFDKLRKLL